MKFFNNFLSAVVVSSMLFGCSSSTEEDTTPGDKEFILNVSEGLEARWKVADDTQAETLSGSKQQSAYEDAVEAEMKAVGKLKKYEFEDEDLKSAAETYMKGLELQEDGVQYVGTDDYKNAQKTWTLGQNYRIVALKTFEKDFGLTVNSKYQTDLDDLLAQYSVAKKEVAIQEFVNNLTSTLTYTKDESQSNEYDIYYTAVIENTTEYTIDSISITVDFKDASGIILSQGDDYIQSFASGSKIQSNIDYWELEEKGEPATIEVSNIDVYYN